MGDSSIDSFDKIRIFSIFRSNFRYYYKTYPLSVESLYVRSKTPVKSFFIIALFLISTYSSAQDSTVYFYDEDGERTVEAADAYTYRIVKLKGEHSYIRHYYASNDQLVMEGTFSRLGTTLIKDGPYKSFYRNGKIEEDGSYKDDRKVGLWRTYYANGQQAEQQVHLPDKIIYHQHWSEDGIPSLVNGTGKFIIGTQHVEVIDSVIFSLFSIDSLTGDSVYVMVETEAKYITGMKGFYAEIEKDLKYPKLARQYHVEGKVFVQFIIGKSGELLNAKVIQGIGGGCDEVALEVLRKRKDWMPGKVRGKPVVQQMILPIAFKLKNGW